VALPRAAAGGEPPAGSPAHQLPAARPDIGRRVTVEPTGPSGRHRGFVPDFRPRFNGGATVGHAGFVPWTLNGFGACFAAWQAAVRHESTGYLDLATAARAVPRCRSVRPGIPAASVPETPYL